MGVGLVVGRYQLRPRAATFPLCGGGGDRILCQKATKIKDVNK